MTDQQAEPSGEGVEKETASDSRNVAASIAGDLSWIDLLKGLAIVGVFFDNWTGYMKVAPSPGPFHTFAGIFSVAIGPFVQVFFILSGFGLAVDYLRRAKSGWSWKRWAWRRFTKIVIPYVLAVLFSFGLGVLGSRLYASVDKPFSWTSLVAYLTFTRNFYPPSWGWNPPLWFMPVIIGLYASFPVLIAILRKWGPWALLAISATITYATLTVYVLLKAKGGHAADLFTFWLLQFALGIVLAHVREHDPQRLRRLTGIGAFLVGLGLVLLSWALRTYVPLGAAFNDSVTSVGIFLVLLNAVWAARAKIPGLGSALHALSDKSYLMYLVHYPILKYLVGPPLSAPMHPAIILTLGGIYVILVFLLCGVIAQPMDRFTSWAYRLRQS